MRTLQKVGSGSLRKPKQGKHQVSTRSSSGAARLAASLPPAVWMYIEAKTSTNTTPQGPSLRD